MVSDPALQNIEIAPLDCEALLLDVQASVGSWSGRAGLAVDSLCAAPLR